MQSAVPAKSGQVSTALVPRSPRELSIQVLILAPPSFSSTAAGAAICRGSLPRMSSRPQAEAVQVRVADRPFRVEDGPEEGGIRPCRKAPKRVLILCSFCQLNTLDAEAKSMRRRRRIR
jgi:hypothetical protein